MKIAWVKLDACGNDFLIVRSPARPGRDVVRAMCEREGGIGADGVIHVVTGDDPGTVAARLFNADGSDGGVSGNGARCVAACMAAQGTPVHHIAFGERIVAVRTTPSGYGIDMGEVTFGLNAVGGDGDGSAALEETIPAISGGACAVAGYGWIGNPHMVLVTGDPPVKHIESMGRVVTESDVFRKGINIHVVRTTGEDRLEMATWERGCGRTRACGSGACTSAALMLELDRLHGDTVTVVMEGGVVTVRRGEDGRMDLEGPVQETGAGIWSEG
ncbi:MAG: diaminopimelate epimerase [Phycisphaerales bacterium]|nr:diaminopimelate epimerase [Phycisphaerales bacterium]